MCFAVGHEDVMSYNDLNRIKYCPRFCSAICGQKWVNTSFWQNFQQYASFLKLFKHMSLFWNSILIKSSFSEELTFNELKFLEKFQVELDFHNFFFFLKLRNLPITRFSKNWVSHWNSIFRKLSFKIGV